MRVYYKKYETRLVECEWITIVRQQVKEGAVKVILVYS